jgi:putative Mg2+ transporter-C (MgtC) family protein
MLVCLGAMLFIRIGQVLISHSEEGFSSNSLRTDPIRLIEAVVTGLAFIGAGTVFRSPHGRHPHGLTTAATILTVGPIGIAVALEHYVLAVGTTVLVFLILRVLGYFEARAITPEDHPAKEPGGQGSPGA